MHLLRRATEQDFDFFYRIKCDEDNMFWCGFTNAPVKENLKKSWMDNVKWDNRNKCREIYIIDVESEPVGYIYIDKLDALTYDLAIAVISSCSGKGYATRALMETLEVVRGKKGKEVQAYVREDNNRSSHVFQKCGFVKRDEFIIKSLYDSTQQVKMNKYLYVL